MCTNMTKIIAYKLGTLWRVDSKFRFLDLKPIEEHVDARRESSSTPSKEQSEEKNDSTNPQTDLQGETRVYYVNVRSYVIESKMYKIHFD